MLVFVEGGKVENLYKNPWSKAGPNNKLNPYMALGGIEPRSHWWDVSALTTAPSLLPIKKAETMFFFPIRPEIES